MAIATVSPKFQIVIPKEIREEMGVRRGQKFSIIVQRGVIKLVPVQPLREYRGFTRGIPTDGYRDETERL